MARYRLSVRQHNSAARPNAKWVLDIRYPNGKRERRYFATKEEAVTEAGIDQGLSFRQLFLFRNAKAIPGGVKTKEVYDKFLAAGGKVFPIVVKDLQMIEAVRTLLSEKPIGFTEWLGQHKRLSQLGMVKEVFASLLAPVAKKEESKPVLATATIPLSKTDSSSAKPPEQAPTTDTASKLVEPSSAILPLGRRIQANSVQEEVAIPAVALTKHTVIRAGSGGGKRRDAGYRTSLWSG